VSTMSRTLLHIIFLFVFSGVAAQTSTWTPVEGKIATPWASEINPQAPLPEYPRPQMQRDAWINLNGLWQYAITGRGESSEPAYDGNILVPFAVESSLSGVGKTVGKDNVL